MKNLKLTLKEWTTIRETYLYHPIFLNDEGLLEIVDINNFKKYLNDWIGMYANQEPTHKNIKNLKSVLSKLN